MASQSAVLANRTLRSDQLAFRFAEQAAALRSELRDGERRGIALIKESGLNIVLTVLRPGARIGGRDTPGACAVQVIEGRIRVLSPGPTIEMGSGELAAFDASVGQEIVALEEATVLITVALDR